MLYSSLTKFLNQVSNSEVPTRYWTGEQPLNFLPGKLWIQLHSCHKRAVESHKIRQEQTGWFYGFLKAWSHLSGRQERKKRIAALEITGKCCWQQGLRKPPSYFLFFFFMWPFSWFSYLKTSFILFSAFLQLLGFVSFYVLWQCNSSNNYIICMHW